MFEVGFTELLLIFVLGLIVLGPERLPRVASQIGRWIGRARSMARQFREQLEEEVNVAETQKWKPASDTQQPSASSSASAPDGMAGAGTSEAQHSAAAPGTSDSTTAGDAHYAGPAPEPEAPAYEPPFFGASTPEAPPASAAETSNAPGAPTDPLTPPDERPARPGDVMTHTHERGI
ncbi:MAG: twin-arginine translocase subunit TatB [Steroidobacteraceae bacterium]|nr:twin-arginine translocase subunit TatB [Steroidobacteraceae bacterium]